ncbi:MAG: UvrD-helicase domain-containing protein [Fibrobacteria bacterium]|nr:UvrD-helicase domain-containing protein [Fibrobacteria bacterium]
MPDRIDLHRHAVIEAHAGTGKTWTIVELVVRLLEERRLPLGEVLLVTYTEKAAGELVDRIRKRLTLATASQSDPGISRHLSTCLENLGEALIGTIHGVCLRLLRTLPFESGTSFSSELVDDEEGLEQCLHEVLREGAWLPATGAEELLPRALEGTSIQGHFAKAKALALKLLDPATNLEPAGIEESWTLPDPGALEASFQARWATSAARRWQARKRTGGLLSFQDMLQNAAEAMRRPDFRRILREKVRVGIIDEFQDTSRLQWSIFRTWFLEDVPESTPREKRPLLFLVGDPKQSIYSFQGADVSTYLEACHHLQARCGAQRASLDRNWRSQPELIEAYNQALGPREVLEGKGRNKVSKTVSWFLDDHPSLGYAPGTQVEPAIRSTPRSKVLPWRLDETPLRLRPVETGGASAKHEWASLCASWIHALRGLEIDLPHGPQWRSKTLDWGDFAVITGSRSGAIPFTRAFDRTGIPWALYKQAGVFSSRACLELRVVLSALHLGPRSRSSWNKALCTRVFRGSEEDLLRSWGLAEKRRWPALLRSLAAPTGFSSRLLAGPQGDKEWMDWRQTTAHALDWLVSGSGNLSELSDHLGRLSRGEESAQEDRNLHARSTDRDRVQILTMHASKGLEFPVVFLAESGVNHQVETHSWIDPEGLHVMPSIVLPKGKKEWTDWHKEVDRLKERAKEERARERRRLHYVAITRPQALLAAPCKKTRPDPLSAALQPLLEELPPRIGILEDAPRDLPATAAEQSAPAAGPVRSLQEILRLDLPSRRRYLTSYSQIARDGTANLSLEGRTARSEEAAEKAAVATPTADEWLPRGARTGDALHEILESWLAPDQDLSWLASGEGISDASLSHVARTLQFNGLPEDLAPRVVELLRGVLTFPLDLGGEGTLRLCDLPPEDRRPEVEFHWAFDEEGRPVDAVHPAKGWMVGYIDLLFRFQGRWFVLDWKTTSLDDWTKGRVEESMEHHGYLLQADLYRNTVARALPAGSPEVSAVYLYLRAFADPASAPSGVWISPSEDTGRTTPAVRDWLHSRLGKEGGR